MYNDPEPEPEPEVPSELLDARSRAKTRARKKPEHPLPDDWQPTDKHRTYAEENGIDLDGEAFRFRNHAESKDRRCVRWDAAFSNWLSKSDRRQPPQRDFRDSLSVVNLDDPANWRVTSND